MNGPRKRHETLLIGESIPKSEKSIFEHAPDDDNKSGSACVSKCQCAVPLVRRHQAKRTGGRTRPKTTEQSTKSSQGQVSRARRTVTFQGKGPIYTSEYIHSMFLNDGSVMYTPQYDHSSNELITPYGRLLRFTRPRAERLRKGQSIYVVGGQSWESDEDPTGEDSITVYTHDHVNNKTGELVGQESPDLELTSNAYLSRSSINPKYSTGSGDALYIVAEWADGFQPPRSIANRPSITLFRT